MKAKPAKPREKQPATKVTAPHAPTPEAKAGQTEWDSLTKFPEYRAKLDELWKMKPNPSDLHGQAVTALHRLMQTEK